MSQRGARADPPQPGHHHLRARRADRPAQALGDRRRPRHLAEDERPRGDRRAPARAQARADDRRRRAEALRAAARLERSARADRRASGSGAFPSGSSCRRSQAPARSASARGASSTARPSTREGGSMARQVVATRFVRACPEGPCRRPGLALLRAWRRRTTADGSSGSTSAARAATSPTSSCAANAGSQRGLYEATCHRAEPPGHLPRRAALARPRRQRGLQAARAGC